MSSISINGKVHRANHEFTYSLSLPAGEHLAVMGPNGSGKSTMLRTLAGLIRLSSGVIKTDSCTLDEPARKTFVAAHERNVTLQHQADTLFPHLSVLDNVAFPYRSRGNSKNKARLDAATLLERLGMSDLRDRFTTNLSGGERAKAILARSLAAEPGVLLLDEPSASLDGEASEEMRQILSNLDQTVILVTHDPVDAKLFGERTAVINNGRIAQIGPSDWVSTRPTSTWAAHMFGINMLRGVAHGSTVEVTSGAKVFLNHPAMGPVVLTFSPNAVTVHAEEPHSSIRNVWRVQVIGLGIEQGRVRVNFTGPVKATALITQTKAEKLALRPGLKCWIAIKANEVDVLPT